MEVARQYADDVVEALGSVDLANVETTVDLLVSAYRAGRSVFVVGNGGSASNASHFAQDLSKGTVPDLEGKRFRVLSLTDNVAFITALANDVGYERVFDLQLRQFAGQDDILVAISGSGNSPNVIAASDCAKEMGLHVISLTGFDGGALGANSDVHLHVPIQDMCKAEAVHSVLLHMVADLLKARLSETPDG